MSWFSPCTNPKPEAMHLCAPVGYKVRDDGAKGRASKCVHLYRLPRVLVLHLKRFTHRTSTGAGKLQKPVRYDATLECGPGAGCVAALGNTSASVSLDETIQQYLPLVS